MKTMQRRNGEQTGKQNQNWGGSIAKRCLVALLAVAMVLSNIGLSQLPYVFAEDDATPLSVEAVTTEEVPDEAVTTEVESEPAKSDAVSEGTKVDSEAPDTADADSESEAPAPKAGIKASNQAGTKAVTKAPAKAPATPDYEIKSADVNEVKTYVQKTTASGSTWEEAAAVGDGDAVKFDIKYHIGSGSVTNGKLYYKLPGNITNLDTNSTLNVVDGNDPTKTIGTYKITRDGDDYYAEIELDSSKIDYTNAFDGTISVEGIAKNAKTSGNDTIDFGGSHTVTVSQNRTVADFSLRKQDGERTPDGNGGGTVSFEYFIGSYNGTNTISINDVATAQNVDIDFSQDVTILYYTGTYKGGTPYPENFSGWGNATSFTVPGANFKNGANYTLPALDAMKGYWVRYSVPYKADANDDGNEKRLSNTVKATTTNAPEAQSTAGITWDKPSIRKTSTKPSNNKAVWTITIGESGQDLSGFVLKDVLTTDPAGALASLKIQQPKTMTITNINGNPANRTINLTDGEYTFPEGTTGYIVLRYTTTLPIIPSSTVKLINTATLTTDEGTQSAVAEEEFVGIPGSYALSKLGPDELNGGDTTNTAVKSGDDITMSWQSTITLPGAGRTANLEDIYYYDYTAINGSSVSPPTTNNWVTKNTLKNDLEIKNSSGQTLVRGTDYVVYVSHFSNSPDYATIKGYYDDTNGHYDRAFNIDKVNNEWLQEESNPDTKKNRFQILFLGTDKIANQDYLTIDYKTYGTLPETEGSTNTYKNSAKITASSEMSAEHVEVKERSSITLDKKIQEEPGSDNYVEPANWWYSGNAEKNTVGYRVRATYNPEADKQTIVIKDTIPEGMEYVAGSGKVTQNRYVKKPTTFEMEDVDLDSSKYSVSYDSATRTITVTITDYDTTTGIIPAFGLDGGPYPINNVGFFYQAKLTDSAWDSKDTTQKRYVNTAQLDGSDEQVTATTNFLRPSDNNTKGSVRVTDYDANDDPVTDTQHEKYYLIINPQAKDLDANSDRLAIEDTVTLPSSVSAEFIYDEVKVYKFADQIPKNPSAEDLTGTEITDFTYTYDEHTHKMSLNVPDEEGLVIVYGYRYATNGSGSTPTVINSATIKGVDDSTSGDDAVISATSSSATVTQRNFRVRKIEEGNAGKLLPGSEFELTRYEANRDSSGKLDTSSNIGTKATVGTVKSSDPAPDEGVATIVLQNVIGNTGTSSSDEVAPYTLFALTETNAPSGYIKSDETYYFAWKDLLDSDNDAYTKLKTAYEKAKQNAADGSIWPAFPSMDKITFAANTGTLNVDNTPEGETPPTPSTYNLTLKKETEQATSEEFEFIIELFTREGFADTFYELDPVPQGLTKIIESGGDVVYYRCKLKKDESLTIPDLPDGIYYRIFEADKEGWEIISVNGEPGESIQDKIDGADEDVTFLNGELAKLTIKKTTEDNKEGHFVFTVKFWKKLIWKAPARPGSRIQKAPPSGYIPYNLEGALPAGFTKIADGEYQVSLANGESVTIPNLPRGVYYEITEQDKTGWELVNVDGDTNKDTAEGSISGDTEVTFHNKQKTVELSGTKTWVDEGLTHDNASEVTLTLKRSAEGEAEEVVTGVTPTWTGNTYTFKDLPEADDNGKVYTYSVEEQAVTNYTTQQTGNNFTNTKDKGKFTVEKAVAGNAADTSKEFTFTITLKDDKGNGVTGTYSDVEFHNGTGTVKLKHGDKKEIETWVGYTYEITEDADGYLADKTSASGTITKNGNTTHKFTNANMQEAVPITFTKKLDNSPVSTANQFTFSMTGTAPTGNDYSKTVGNDADGKVAFDGITYTQNDVNKTYTYEVKETTASSNNFECDDTVYTIRDTVALDNAKDALVITRTIQKGNEQPTPLVGAAISVGGVFNNYTLIDISGTKTWVDGDRQHDNANDVTLTLTRKIGNGQPETVNKTPSWTDGTYKYTGLRKTNDDGEEYTYEVSEDDIQYYTKEQNGNNFTNTRDEGQFTVEKAIRGNATSSNDTFTFKVYLTDDKGQPVTGTFSGVSFSNGNGTFTLSGGQRKTIKTYAGYKYTITESDSGDYTSDRPNGVPTTAMVKDDDKTYTFTNTKNTYGDITIEKKLAGNTKEPSKEFSFKVSILKEDGSVDTTFAETLKDGAGNDVTFNNGVATVTVTGESAVTVKGFPNGTKYKIEESDYSSDGYEAVKFGNNDTSVAGTIAGGEAAESAFTDKNSNTTYVATNTKDTYGDLVISKKLTGNDIDKDHEFAFTVTLTNKDGAAIKDTMFGDYKTDENGKITIRLKGDEEATIPDLPNGTNYSITEEDYSAQKYDAVQWAKRDGEDRQAIDGHEVTGTIEGAKPENSSVAFVATNHRDTYGDLVVRKELKGDCAEEDREFAFTVTLSEKLNGEYGEMTFKEGVATFTLKGGETKTARDLPNGTTYKVEEDDYTAAGYSTSYDDKAEGTIVGTITEPQPQETTVTNTTITRPIELTKVWDDEDDQDGLRPEEITLRLKVAGEEDVVETLTLTAKDNWAGKFTVLDNGTKYVVEEEPVPDYIRQTAGDETDGYTFTNIHRPWVPKNPKEDETYGGFTLQKTVSGVAEKDKEYTFQVTIDYADDAYEDYTGTVSLRPDEKKVYDYIAVGATVTVVEQRAENYTVTYTVDGKAVTAKDGETTFEVAAQDADYQVVCNNDRLAPPTSDEGPKTPPAKRGKGVKTGDAAPLGVLGLLALAAGGALVATRRRREN